MIDEKIPLTIFVKGIFLILTIKTDIQNYFNLILQIICYLMQKLLGENLFLLICLNEIGM